MRGKKEEGRQKNKSFALIKIYGWHIARSVDAAEGDRVNRIVSIHPSGSSPWISTVLCSSCTVWLVELPGPSFTGADRGRGVCRMTSPPRRPMLFSLDFSVLR